MRVKRNVYSGAVCEVEIYSVSDHTRKISKAEPRPRFKSQEEREQHRLAIARKHHARLVNANFGPSSLYSTLTFDRTNEVHTLEMGWKIGTNFMRRLHRLNPDARYILHMGWGRSTKRLHFHMISDGLTEEQIRSKWPYGETMLIEHLRDGCKVKRKNYGRDYTGLANYLFDHWQPGMGKHHYRASTNLVQPEKGEAKQIRRKYNAQHPPKAPKGYRYTEFWDSGAGYLCFKFVKEEPDASPPGAGQRPQRC